uniref:Integrin subunit alpha 6 n=1 Tax=Cyclopterus lumpus TaxID=8103 RepID=A0A8C2WLP5_CYCLU
FYSFGQSCLSACGLWTVVFLLGCGRLSAFNLDTENVLQHTGDKGSLFGFSLAMHQQVDPEDKRMLLVGAPRAKRLWNQKSEVTGGLYKCSITSHSMKCDRVDFDNHEDTEKESKENQWMGVSVNSQGPGGKIVTCAHRYKRRARVNTDLESRDIIGRCYVLSQSLTINPSSSEEGGSWHFCESRPRGHEMFGSCQQGLSATFDKDYHYIIFGAPGAYDWRGVVRLEQKNESFIEMDIFDDGPFEVGDEDEKNPALVPAPPNSYLGFSLASGMGLTKKGQLTVVSGAPRANHSGSVVLLKKGDDTTNILLEEFTLEGEGLASSFGYDVAVLDLNADGWLDIVVGAPQYFEKDGIIGGAVYVYVNKAGKWNSVTPTRINGPQDSMFGVAVENLGDINQDGYDDFAVGAPYDNNGAGNVYIYQGAANGLRSEKVLSGQSLGGSLFGYSLAGNFDLDKNAYLDLAVGSLSDSVFLFRTRPVISIKKEIKFSPKQIDFTDKKCGSNFWFVSLFSVGRKGKVHSASASHTGSCSIDIFFLLSCSKCILGVDRKRRQSSTQIPPVLDANEPMKTQSEVNFLKEGCGRDNVCQSNLQVNYRYGHRTTDEGIFTPLELTGGMPVIKLSDQKDITLEVKVSNLDGDDAHEASLIATFPRSLTYSASRSAPTELEVTCKANKNGSMADCDLGNPFRHNSETTFYIILSTSGISFNTTELEITLQLVTTSSQEKIAPIKAKLKVVTMLQLSLSGQAQPSQVYFTGKVKSESDMKTESDIGSAITHQFRIINLGKHLEDFGTTTLDIHWPKVTVKGKWLLYLMDISSTGVNQLECSPKGEVNPLKMVTENTEGSDEATFSRLLDKKSKTLSCDDGANCVTIKCTLRGLESSAVITLKSRLWNSTFIEITSYIVRVKRDLKVRLTVFPKSLGAQYAGVPWWIIVLSILFGLLLLALLAFLLWKCGFFRRAKYEDRVPSYNAVCIKREERARNARNGNWEKLEKQPWVTTWHDKEHCS